MIGRPYHNDPGLNHGIPDEFQVLGYPILSALDPQDRDCLGPGTSTKRFFADGRTRSTSATCGPRTTRPTRAQKVWAAKFAARHPQRRAARPRQLQVRPRRADLRHHRQDHRPPARRPTPRCTTSTPTSPAARSRSASRPTRTAQAPRGGLDDAGQAAGAARQSLDDKRLELLSSRRPAGRRAHRPRAREADRRAWSDRVRELRARALRLRPRRASSAQEEVRRWERRSRSLLSLEKGSRHEPWTARFAGTPRRRACGPRPRARRAANASRHVE